MDCSSSNKEFGESARQLGFADARRAHENERADRPLRIGKTGAAAAHCIGDVRKRVILADHAHAQALFHVDELVDFAFEQAAGGNSRPLAHYASDFLFADFFFQHRVIFLQRGELFVGCLQLFLRGGELAVTNLCDFS